MTAAASPLLTKDEIRSFVLALLTEGPRRDHARAQLDRLEPDQLYDLLDVLGELSPPVLYWVRHPHSDLGTDAVCTRLARDNPAGRRRAFLAGLAFDSLGPEDLPIVLEGLESEDSDVVESAAWSAALWNCSEKLLAADAAERIRQSEEPRILTAAAASTERKPKPQDKALLVLLQSAYRYARDELRRLQEAVPAAPAAPAPARRKPKSRRERA